MSASCGTLLMSSAACVTWEQWEIRCALLSDLKGLIFNGSALRPLDESREHCM